MGLAPGTHAGRRLGRYTLVRSLGAGGMAELFLARADGIGGFAKLVALKRILPHKASNERFVRMLLNEARLVAALEHPNIAAVYDICFEDNEYFFAMEYVHGHDLRRILHAAPSHMLRIENVLHVVIGVCAGLHHAHEARDPSGQPLGIVHRDVSPSNVLVSYQGAVKLVDFGVAKAATMVSETREGVIKGKHGYMSPEQCLGDKLDRRSDLFAVGILLWEMTVGRRLYKVNGELATLQRIVYADAPRPSKFIDGCPPELERIIMRALARDVAARYQTAQELQIDLEAFALAHQLPVSSVGMTQEMSEMFRDRIDAWREAERAGRSLADHLADASSEDSMPSTSDADDEADDPADAPVAADARRFPSEPSAVTEVLPMTVPGKSLGAKAQPPGPDASPIPQAPAEASRTSSPAIATSPAAASRTSSPAIAAQTPEVVLAAGRKDRTHLTVIAIVVLMLLGGAAFAWLLLFRRPPAETTDEPSPVLMAGIADDATAGGAGEIDAAEVAVVVTVDREPQEIEHEPTTDAAETVPADATAVDAIEPVDGDEPADRSGTSSPRDKRHRKKPRTTTIASVPKVAAKEPCQPPGAVDPFDKRPVCSGAPPPPKDTPPKDTPPKDTPPKDTTPKVTTPGIVKPSGPAPGTMDAVAVRAVVKSRLGEITACVSRARMDDRDLTGKVQLRIDVSPGGRVTRTSITSSKGATPALEACMMRAVASWTFPAPAGGVRGAFSYPFAF